MKEIKETMIRAWLAKLLPDPLPVLKAMPAHVTAVRLDVGLLMYQMDAWREHKSPAVNNSPYMATKEKS